MTTTAKPGQRVLARFGDRWVPGRVVAVDGDGTIHVTAGAATLAVHRSCVRRDLRLHPRANARRAARAEVFRSLGLVKTAYGWE